MQCRHSASTPGDDYSCALRIGVAGYLVYTIEVDTYIHAIHTHHLAPLALWEVYSVNNNYFLSSRFLLKTASHLAQMVA